jgi:hypothetical protein
VESKRTLDENGYLETIITSPDGKVQHLEYIYNKTVWMSMDHPPPTSPGNRGRLLRFQ